MRCSHGISDLLRTSMILGRLENRVFSNGGYWEHPFKANRLYDEETEGWMIFTINGDMCCLVT